MISATTTTLTINALSTALECANDTYSQLCAELIELTAKWGYPAANPTLAVKDDSGEVIISDIKRAVVAKWVIARLVRTCPQALPPENLVSPTLFVEAVIQLGDAQTLDQLASGADNLQSIIKSSSWDVNVEPTIPAAATDAVDELGGPLGDVGEVVSGPSDADLPPARKT